jgi:hypothetical protein
LRTSRARRAGRGKARLVNGAGDGLVDGLVCLLSHRGHRGRQRAAHEEVPSPVLQAQRTAQVAAGYGDRRCQNTTEPAS